MLAYPARQDLEGKSLVGVLFYIHGFCMRAAMALASRGIGEAIHVLTLKAPRKKNTSENVVY